MSTRADVVQMALSAVGTAFHRNGRKPGIGLDCAGLVICVARELGFVAPDFDVPAYTNPDGTLIDTLNLNMTPIARRDMRAGDVVAINTADDPFHVGILYDYRADVLGIIHASSDRLHQRVIAQRLMFSANFRFAGAWAFHWIE